MKKFIITAIFLTAAASIAHAQHTVIDKRAGMMIEGRPFFTDAGVYNSYDLAGSPLGRFEIDSTSRMNAELGYRRYSLGDESANYLGGQTVRMGEPGRAFFEVFYGPDFLTHKNSLNPNQNEVSLTLQRFGMALAAQSEGGSFRSSLSATGSMGNQTWEYGDSSRTLWTLEKLRIDMGSQVHPFVRINFYAGATLRLDTLYGGGTAHEDRSAQMNLPELGGSIDLGSEELPVRGHISMSYASSYLLYTSKGIPAGTFPPSDGNGNVNPIAGDSLKFFMMVQGFVPVNESYIFSPGLLFGHSSSSGREHVPHEDNDNPFKIGNRITGRDYNLSGIHFGIGTGFEADKYANLYAEYSLAAMSLECGQAYLPPVTKSRTLHHVSFGASTALQKYLEMPLNITPRISYFISGSAGIVDAVHSDLGPVNIYPGKSKAALYTPSQFLEGFARTSGFTFGIDALALENKLAASFWMTFLSKDTESKGGLELGVSAGFKL